MHTEKFNCEETCLHFGTLISANANMIKAEKYHVSLNNIYFLGAILCCQCLQLYSSNSRTHYIATATAATSAVIHLCAFYVCLNNLPRCCFVPFVVDPLLRGRLLFYCVRVCVLCFPEPK